MPSKSLALRRIAFIKSTPAILIGYVDAPDAESAIKKAIEEFEIKDRLKPCRLIVQLHR
jgi:hypothetical protein